ncbi:MAG: YihY family inner membrane protein [Bdellovibrionales bacterium]|nr:YihY family inner membrane protein [Bdellovibrionales bacterium]
MKSIRDACRWVAWVIGSAANKFYWDDCFSRASSLAYTTLFALVPISALTFALFKGFAIQEGQAYLESIITQVLPSGQTVTERKPEESIAALLGAVAALGEEYGLEVNVLALENTLQRIAAAAGDDSAGRLEHIDLKLLRERARLFLERTAAEQGVEIDPVQLDEDLQEVLPEQHELLHDLKVQVFDFMRELGENVRDAGVVTLGVLLFVGIALLNTIESALNAVWRVTSSQSILSKVISFWAVISLGPLLLAVSLYWYSRFGQLTHGDPLFDSKLFSIVNFLVPMAAIWVALTLMFYRLPGARVQLRDAAFGAFVAAVGFECMKRLFAYYVSVSTTYSTFYGVLVTIPLFLFWLYLVWCVVLFGAEISYQAGAIKVLSGLRKYASDLGEIGAVLGLRIMYVIGKRFDAGAPPPTESEIAIETGSDPVLVRTCLGILTAADLITVADPEAHTRALVRSPEKITVSDVVRAFHSKAHRRANGKTLLIHEMPFMQAIRNTALRLGDTRNVDEWTLSELASDC